jgi:hypothetical protein
MLTRQRSSLLLGALIFSVAGAVAIGASAHYKKGGQPVCTADGGTVTCSSGLVAGLGNFDVVVSISFTATQGQVCHNKGNPDNFVQGQNPATGTGGGGVSIPAGDIKNGTLVVPSITGTAVLTAGTAASAGCPNSNWTVTLEGPITITGGQYIFQSPPGTTIDKLSFTF